MNTEDSVKDNVPKVDPIKNDGIKDDEEEVNKRPQTIFIKIRST